MNISRRLRPFIRITKHSLPVAGVIGFIVAMFIFSLPPLIRTDVKSPKAHSKETTTKHQVVQVKIKPVTTPPVKPPVSTPVTKPAPQPTVIRTQPKPVPVKPAPSSSVSNLQTAPATSSPSGSSSSSSGSSSGGSSGSGSSGSSTGSTSLPPATANYSSSNWSGYFAVSAKYSAVSGSWVAPTPTGNSSSTTTDATWIGIGGITTNDLIQVGTDNTVSPSGQISTEAFYEMLPYPAVTITSLSITAGDSIQASISEVSSGEWAITLTDSTTGQTYTNNFAYNSSLSSAEWIEEDPSDISGSLLPFDDFGEVSFTKSRATISGGSPETLAAASADSVEMVDSKGNPIAVPSVLRSDGESFNVTWQ